MRWLNWRFTKDVLGVTVTLMDGEHIGEKVLAWWRQARSCIAVQTYSDDLLSAMKAVAADSRVRVASRRWAMRV